MALPVSSAALCVQLFVPYHRPAQLVTPLNRLLCVVLAMLCISSYAAQEWILSYNSDIEVDTLGGVTVTETISVVAAGENIKHGIYRMVPTRLYGRFGEMVFVDFELLSITRNGLEEPYRLYNETWGKSIYIGDSDKELRKGKHTYEIRYYLGQTVRYFNEHDELYWNVTGNGWSFSMDSVRARVLLPAGASIITDKLSAYSGPAGATGCECTQAEVSPREVVFFTTSTLGASEGLTIAVPFSKGIVKAPDQQQKLDRFLKDNMVIVYCVGGLLAALLYYVVAWLIVGRDPKPRIATPAFEPPKGLAPYEARYIDRMGFDPKCFVTAIVSLAQKGYFTIVDMRRGDYKFVKAEFDPANVPEVEKKMVERMLGKNDELEISSGAYNPELAGAQRILKNHLGRIRSKYFWRNYLWMFPGMLICIAAVVQGFLSIPGGAGVLGLIIGTFTSLWYAVVVVMAMKAVNAFKSKSYAEGVMAVVAVLIFGGFGLLLLSYTSQSTGPVPLVIIALMTILTALFFYLIKAPTRAGRAMMDNIQDFAMFLRTAEMPRINTLTSDLKMDMDLFGRYLPYAIALDLQTAWTSHFNAADDAAPHANWYRGVTNLHVNDWSNRLVSNFGHTLSLSTIKPSSSSGSGGGGSSGGGSGGGGGGGW